MFKNIRGVKAALLLLAASVTLSWGDMPPPPVNQNLGVPDSTFNNMERENCWYCHIPSRLTPAERTNLGWNFAVPEQIKPGVVTDRHHARVGTPMQPLTQAPFNAVEGEPYGCLNCHQIAYNPAIGANEVVQNFVNCLNCHVQMPGQASVHHLTGPAQAKNCMHCHGSRIDNPGDGHYIPTGRPATEVTPRTSAGIGVNGQGACNFCHNNGTESVSGVKVGTNGGNHHSTGIGQPGVSDLDCAVCHDPAYAPGSPLSVRRCEDCHGINSIHNIQADSNGDGALTVGGEDAYWGHIGNQTDCIGCHGGFQQASEMAAPLSGPVVPQINDMSAYQVTAGTTATITISGNALTNELYAPDGTKIELESRITLTAADGTVTELTPNTISESSLEVTIPGDLAAGNYYVRAVKISNQSNPLSLTVIPEVTISSVSAAGNAVTVDGSGFGEYLNAANSGTDVTVAGATCSVDSWTDTQIVANCATAQCGQLTVNGVYGSASSNVACADDARTKDQRRTRDTRR